MPGVVMESAMVHSSRMWPRSLAGREPAPQSCWSIWLGSSGKYYERKPDLADPTQLVTLGTSGTEARRSAARSQRPNRGDTPGHLDYRRSQGIDGPLYLGKTPTSVPGPASASALEVLAANSVETIIHRDERRPPPPGDFRGPFSGTIAPQTHHTHGCVTPSHNPPEDGGFKYTPANGGPADST